jgi:hypothetical protein
MQKEMDDMIPVLGEIRKREAICYTLPMLREIVVIDLVKE